jgi:hypothetical protein
MNYTIQDPREYTENLTPMNTSTPVDASEVNPYIEALLNNDAFMYALIERVLGKTIEELDEGETIAALAAEFETLHGGSGASGVGFDQDLGMEHEANVESALLALAAALQALAAPGGAAKIGVDHSDIESVQEYLDALQDWVDSASVNWNDIEGKPSTFEPKAHTHTQNADLRIATGTANFPPNPYQGIIITHGLGVQPSFVMITPTENPNGYLGEVWVTDRTTTKFTAHRSGSYQGGFMWMAKA